MSLDYHIDAQVEPVEYIVRCNSLLDDRSSAQNHSCYASSPSFRLAHSSATHTEQSVARGKPFPGRLMKAGGSGSDAQREDQTNKGAGEESQVSVEAYEDRSKALPFQRDDLSFLSLEMGT